VTLTEFHDLLRRAADRAALPARIRDRLLALGPGSYSRGTYGAEFDRTSPVPTPRCPVYAAGIWPGPDNDVVGDCALKFDHLTDDLASPFEVTA
jgi:hypothetical protein